MTRSEEAYVGQGELHSALLLRPSHLQLEMLRPAAVVLVEGVPSVRTEEPAGHPLAETSQCAAQCSALQSVCVLQGSVVKVREHSAVQCTALQYSTVPYLLLVDIPPEPPPQLLPGEALAQASEHLDTEEGLAEAGGLLEDLALAALRLPNNPSTGRADV